MISEVNAEIEKGIKANQSKAARHVVKELKRVVGDVWAKGTGPAAGEAPAKRYGDLQAGIGFQYDKNLTETKVGFRRPAYHAHLMEFGTDTRYQLTTKTKKSGKITLLKPRYVGYVAPHPFFQVTLIRCKEKVKDILSEPIF